MKFLFCSLDSMGFLCPSVGIAKALIARGHDVAFVTDVKFAKLLTTLDLERIPRGNTDGGSFQVPQWAKPISVAIQVKHIEYALDRFDADVLFGQALTLGPMVVAERRGLPLGLLGFCAYLWPTDNDPPRRGDLTAKRLRWRYGDMMEVLNTARALFHLPACHADCRDTPLLGDLFLLRSVPELEPHPERLPEHVHFVGGCLWELATHDPELEDWIVEAKKSNASIIYVHHGKFFHISTFWDALVRAVEGLNVRVAASVGQMGRPVGSVPDNFLVRPHISQAAVLRHARLLVAGGNTTAVVGAMEAGVPSLLIPAGGEQPEVAELAERCGAAKSLLPEEATMERLRPYVEDLLANPLYSERATFYQSAFTKLDGFERAADLLEKLAVTKARVLREPASGGLQIEMKHRSPAVESSADVLAL